MLSSQLILRKRQFCFKWYFVVGKHNMLSEQEFQIEPTYLWGMTIRFKNLRSRFTHGDELSKFLCLSGLVYCVKEKATHVLIMLFLCWQIGWKNRWRWCTAVYCIVNYVDLDSVSLDCEINYSRVRVDSVFAAFSTRDLFSVFLSKIDAGCLLLVE